VAGGQVVGWVDYDTDRDWLPPDQVNMAHQVLPEQRGRGYATRVVRLPVEHLAAHRFYREATLLLDERNAASLRVAARLSATATSTGPPPMPRFFVLPVRSAEIHCSTGHAGTA
jgi:RimJ/RimL family protein N-acetyltransferase